MANGAAFRESECKRAGEPERARAVVHVRLGFCDVYGYLLIAERLLKCAHTQHKLGLVIAILAREDLRHLARAACWGR